MLLESHMGRNGSVANEKELNTSIDNIIYIFPYSSKYKFYCSKFLVLKEQQELGPRHSSSG
jgi:hypothetical protein